MSPQHDWLTSLGPDPEASAEAKRAVEASGEGTGSEAATGENDSSAAADGALAEADAGRGESSDSGSAPVDSDSTGEASSVGVASVGAADAAGEAGESAEAGPPAGASIGERDRSGWSGRAVGPLSGLLPGAVELKADELPAEPTGVLVADGEQPIWTEGGTDFDGVLAGEASPGTAPDEAVEVAEEPEPEEPEPSPSATDDRWRAVLVGFVDDPRGSVDAARALIDEDIATHLALFARRKEAMHAALDASKNADTEALRVTLVSYRDLRKRLADVLDALTP
jgi:hypothetical protein